MWSVLEGRIPEGSGIPDGERPSCTVNGAGEGLFCRNLEAPRG